MSKALKEAIKRLDKKEPQFQSNTIQASNQRKIIKQKNRE